MRHGWIAAVVLVWVSVAAGQTSRPAMVDIAYKSGEQLSDYEKQRCKLDLYLPPEGVKDFPTVVWFYGGGLEGGDKGKGWSVKLAYKLASQGIACAVVDYRLSPKVQYPAYVDDAAASVAWVLGNISQHGGDAKQVFVSGHSAGGYLVAQVGFDPRPLAKYGVKTSQIAGLIPFSPQVFTHWTVRKERGVPDHELTPLIDDAAPVFHVRPDAPRTLIFVADKDNATRLEECAYFVAVAKAKKHPDVSMMVIAERNHGSIFVKATQDGDPALVAMLEFIHRPAATTRPATQPAR